MTTSIVEVKKTIKRKRGADWKTEKMENGKYSGLAGQNDSIRVSMGKK